MTTMVRNSTHSFQPRKPYSSFPLWANSNGQRAKKIHGKVYCFGTWERPQEALAKYKTERHYLETGIRPKSEGWTVKNAIDYFLDRLQSDVDDGEKSKRNFDDCLATGKQIVTVMEKQRQVVDLDGSDFFELRRKFSKKKDGKLASPDTRDGHIRRTMAIFNRSVNDGKVDRVIFGSDFRKKTKKDKAVQAASSESKFIEAADLQAQDNGTLPPRPTPTSHQFLLAILTETIGRTFLQPVENSLLFLGHPGSGKS